jgi:uncharacterized protein (DUF2336 family)
MLSQSDIDRLMTDRSPDAQMDIVEKLTAQYTTDGDGALNTQESAIADNIFGLLMKNAEVQVRKTMAANLSLSHKLPPDLARTMAADVTEVAAPILEHSEVLSDEDLMQIIGTETQAEKLEAIARRKVVSEVVSDALVETRIESVVKTVVVNEGAAISEQTFDKIADRHHESVEVMGSIFQRSSVPPAIVEKVMERITDNVRESLEKQYGDLVELQEFKKAFAQSMELTSLKMLGFHSTDKELMRVLHHMDGSNKVTPFSALSMANLELFEVSLSRLLRVPVRNIKILLADDGGLRRTYEAAELPEFLFEATELTVHALLKINKDNAKAGIKEPCTPYQLMQYMRELAAGKEIDGIDYIYALMQQSQRKGA